MSVTGSASVTGSIRSSEDAAEAEGSGRGARLGGTSDGLGPALTAVIAGLAVLGNASVIAVLRLRRDVFRSFNNHLILNQSVIDLIGGVMFYLNQAVLKPSLSGALGSDSSPSLNDFLCFFVMYDYIVWCLHCASTYSLVVISVERYVATCHPVWHRNACRRRVKAAAMALPWVAGFVVISALGTFSLHVSGRCQNPSGDPVWIAVNVTASFLLLYAGPVVTILCAYGKIFLALRRKRRGVNPRCAQAAFGRARKNVVVTTMLTGLMFLICWTPSYAFSWAAHFGELPEGAHLPLYNATASLVACNLFVNPIVYSFAYRRFREQLVDIVRGRVCRGRGRIRPRDPGHPLAEREQTNETVAAPV